MWRSGQRRIGLQAGIAGHARLEALHAARQRPPALRPARAPRRAGRLQGDREGDALGGCVRPALAPLHPTCPAHHACAPAPATVAGAVPNTRQGASRRGLCVVRLPRRCSPRIAWSAKHTGCADLCSRSWLSRCGCGRPQCQRHWPLPGFRTAQLQPAQRLTVLRIVPQHVATALRRCEAPAQPVTVQHRTDSECSTHRGTSSSMLNRFAPKCQVQPLHEHTLGAWQSLRAQGQSATAGIPERSCRRRRART